MEEKKKTIKIGEYATLTNKSKQGIYQAIKRPQSKYQKYLTTDEDGKTVFKIEILKELDAEVEEQEPTEEKQTTSPGNEKNNAEIVFLLKEQITDLKKEIDEKNKQIERLQLTIENNQHIIHSSQQLLLLNKANDNSIIEPEEKTKKHKILWFLNK